MNRWTRWIIASSLGVVWASGVSAERVEWKSEDGGNGHAYEAVVADDPISAADAHQAAEEKGGHLATITSRKENDFVFKLVDDDKYWGTDDYGNGFGPWIGGRQDPDAKAVDAGWRWVTGEEWKYTNWSPGAGEPNDSDGVEDHGEDFITFFAFGSSDPADQWNDSYANSSAVFAYVIEWTPKEELEAARAKQRKRQPRQLKPTMRLRIKRMRAKSKPVTIRPMPIPGANHVNPRRSDSFEAGIEMSAAVDNTSLLLYT